ncbi:hypothetical protein GGI07_002250 [Coemansia sp. Benny D115]|nr:hypothetical protein GGI07_002250 [Coemansia sp. Benny D115]
MAERTKDNADVRDSLHAKGQNNQEPIKVPWAAKSSEGKQVSEKQKKILAAKKKLKSFQAKRAATQQQQPPNMARMRTASNHISTISDGAFPIPAYANSAPIRHSKHLRSFSMGQAPPATNTSALGAAVPNAAAGAANGAASLASNGAGAAGAAVDAAALHPLHAYELLEPVPFRSYVGHTADVLALSWSKNGFLLSASADRTVRLWHPHRPECLCTFRHRDIVTSVAFNPRDDRLFVSGSLDCRLRLWDIPARGVRHWTGLPDGQMVTAVSFVGSQGDRIVAGTYRGMCVFYETDGLAVLGRMHARSSRGRNAQGSKITGFAYSDTGPPQHGSVKKRQPLLLVSSNDSRLRMFLPEARTLERKYKGHANASSQAYARLSSDARFIISGSEDHNVYVWPVAQDNAATVATNPASDSLRIERVQRSLLGTLFRKNTAANGGRKRATSSASQQSNHQTKQSQQQQQQSHESSASVADGDGDGNASGNASGNANQQQEWDSLDGRVEEKSIYEYFAAHDSPVSQALFAPSATLQYLAAHGDPILSRPKLRRTGRSGDVENLCSVSADGCFHGTPDGHLTDDTTVEDTTAIIVSADNNGNIRVFRKDINVLAEASGSTATSIAAPPEEEESDSDASTTDTRSFNGQPSRSGTGSIRTTSSRNFTPSALPQSPTTPAPARPQSQAHVQQPSPLTPRASPSFWNRLGRRVSQRRASQAGSTHGSSTVAAPPASDACQYCGHHKFVEFAVAPTQATGSSNGASGLPKVAPSLHVCENCKRVKNMPL